MGNLIADATNELQTIYFKLNEKYYENKLPEVIISIQASPRNKYYGWFWKNKWFKPSTKPVDFMTYDDKNPMIVMHEINISAEYLDRGVTEIIGTLNHEMVHLYCEINGIKDTSNNRVYHNKRFKQEAEQRGLVVEHAKTIGWSKASVGQELKDFIVSMCVNESVFDFCRNKTSKKMSAAAEKAVTTTYKCPDCERSVRGEIGFKIMCGFCNKEMVSKK